MFHQFLLLVVLLNIFITESNAYNQKPIYHFTPEDGHWINDPNGPFYDAKYNRYHVFSQYNPNAPYWGDMSWIHWISEDFVKWETLPVAITNDQSYDRGGAFSGSAILADEKTQLPYLVYTCVEEGTGIQNQCYAWAKDSMDSSYVSWAKSTKNPMIDLNSLPPGSNGASFRDPTLWKHSSGNNTWSVALAAQLYDVGHVVRYDCTVLTSPEETFSCNYYSSMWNSGNSSTSAFKTYMVECPDFYPVNQKLYVLKYSIMEEWRDLYELGTYDEEQGIFIRDISKYNTRLEYDYGPNFNFYASKRFYDPKKNRQVLLGWSNERDDQSVARNWAGVLTLPREVQFDESFGILRFTVLKEIEQLRQVEQSILPVLKSTNESMKVYQLNIPSPSLAMEIRVIVDVVYSMNASDASCSTLEVGLLGRQSSDGTAYVKHAIGIRKNPAESQSILYSVIDTLKAGGTTPSMVYERDIPSYDANHEQLFTTINKDEETKHIQIDLIIFYDHSIIEMYALHGAHASTLRVYPDELHTGVSIYTSSCLQDVVLTPKVKVWNMNTIWK